MKDIYGRANAKQIKKLEKIAKLVDNLAKDYAEMSNEQLAAQTEILRNKYKAGATLDQLLPDAYAVCREASARVLHQRHYHVQVLGGIAIHQGRICQMATGEGKTLTETLPAYLNALTGEGVHIMTVNEYLAVRDMEWMGKVFKFLGLTVGVTLNSMSDEEKRQAYLCDITYGTNHEFGFDYLRDNTKHERSLFVQRGLNFVIVDEVDSILIDEARTPLILSGPSGKTRDEYVTANKFVVQNLVKSTNVDQRGETKSKEEQPNGDYVVDMKDRQVRLTDSGIAKAEKFYQLENLSDPQNIEINSFINNALRAHALMHRDDEYIVERGQVVIIDSFTGRKMEGRRFSAGLHQAIEAKERLTIREENKTMASITFPNLFRLYKKVSGMTGTAKTEEDEFRAIYNIDVVCIPTNKPLARVDLPDVLYAKRQLKMNAIVDEIERRNKVGQPILVGTISVEKNEELHRLLDARRIKHQVLNAKEHQSEADIIAQAGRLGFVTIATNMAGRGTDILLGGNPEFLARQEMKRLRYTSEQIEMATDYSKTDAESLQLQEKYAELLQKNKAITEDERQKVIELGGLCVIGTEKHDSRRIDNQLRGRAGRQGDVGCSMFFVSLEDDMLRTFGEDRIRMATSLLGGVLGNEPITHKMLTKITESVQKRVEGIHFSVRKNLLNYDNVVNLQRKTIYGERNRILDGANIHQEILEMAQEYVRYALGEACDGEEDASKWDLEKVNKKLLHYFPENIHVQVMDKRLSIKADDLHKHFASNVLVQLTEENVKSARQVCKMLTDRCVEHLEWRKNNPLGDTQVEFELMERRMLLSSIDYLWMDHIDALDDLKQGVGLQSIGQHDPLVVYKKEAYEMFEKLNEQIKVRTIGLLLTAISFRPKEYVPFLQLDPSISHNQPCPCGSGKKYKDCCLPKALALQEQQQQEESQVEEERELTRDEIYAQKRAQRKLEKNKNRK